MRSSSGSTRPSQASASSAPGMGSVVLLASLVLVAFASGGYFFGTQMNFQRMEQGGSSEGLFNFALPFGPAAQLKKTYWLHTTGWEKAGYVITVAVNGNTVDKFYKPGLDVEVTRFIRPGRNTITFNAKSLPIDQRSDSSSAHLTIELKSADKPGKGEKVNFSSGDTLIEYTRQVTDTEDFNETKEFETIE